MGVLLVDILHIEVATGDNYKDKENHIAQREEALKSTIWCHELCDFRLVELNDRRRDNHRKQRATKYRSHKSHGRSER